MSIFTGSAVAIVTPMFENGEVNYDELGRLIDFQIENETDCIVICGTTGEASTLSHEEHLECIRYAIERTAGRVPVVAGTGSNSTETAVYLSTEAEKYGADGLLLVSPYYNKATQKGLMAHFGAVAEKVNIPIILYNVPGRTGCNILPETAVALAKKYDNIVAIKEASGNISQVVKLASIADGCLDIYSGNDDQVLPLLSVGGKGVISVLANVAPKQTHDMVMKYLEGDTKEAIRLQLSLLPLINQLFCEVNPIPVKKAVEMMGFAAGPLRLPLTEIEDAHRETLEAAMREAGII